MRIYYLRRFNLNLNKDGQDACIDIQSNLCSKLSAPSTILQSLRRIQTLRHQVIVSNLWDVVPSYNA